MPLGVKRGPRSAGRNPRKLPGLQTLKPPSPASTLIISSLIGSWLTGRQGIHVVYYQSPHAILLDENIRIYIGGVRDFAFIVCGVVAAESHHGSVSINVH